MRILALDPGGLTGWAVLDEPLRLMASGQLEEHNCVVMLHGIIDSLKPDEIVCESYRMRPAKSGEHSWSDMKVSRLIGDITGLVRELGLPLVMQGPSCKTFFTNDLLRVAGVLPPGDHAKDAVRHTLYRSWFGLGHKKDPAVRAVLHKYTDKRG